MIELVGTGISISMPMIYAILTFGIIALLQPWSISLKIFGFMIGIGAYALIPFVLSGGV